MEFIVIWKHGFDKLCYGAADSLQGAIDVSLLNLVHYLRNNETTADKLQPQLEIVYIGASS